MSALRQLRTLLTQPWFDANTDRDHAYVLYDAAMADHRRNRAITAIRAEVNWICARLLDIDTEHAIGEQTQQTVVERNRLRKRLKYLRGVR